PSQMQFVSMARLRTGPTDVLPNEREPGLYGMEWSRLSKQIQLLGCRVLMMLNVLGNNYGLLIVGEAEDPKALPRIDALCKREGFEAKTHLAVAAEEYARLVHEIARTIHRGPVRAGRSDEQARA